MKREKKPSTVQSEPRRSGIFSNYIGPEKRARQMLHYVTEHKKKLFVFLVCIAALYAVPIVLRDISQGRQVRAAKAANESEWVDSWNTTVMLGGETGARTISFSEEVAFRSNQVDFLYGFARSYPLSVLSAPDLEPQIVNYSLTHVVLDGEKVQFSEQMQGDSVFFGFGVNTREPEDKRTVLPSGDHQLSVLGSVDEPMYLVEKESGDELLRWHATSALNKVVRRATLKLSSKSASILAQSTIRGWLERVESNEGRIVMVKVPGSERESPIQSEDGPTLIFENLPPGTFAVAEIRLRNQ